MGKELCKKCGSCCNDCEYLKDRLCSIYFERNKCGKEMCETYPLNLGDTLMFGCGYVEHWFSLKGRME